jgi:hypothetical protein
MTEKTTCPYDIGEIFLFTEYGRVKELGKVKSCYKGRYSSDC